MKGSPVYVEKLALKKPLNERVGKQVELEFRGDQYDADLSITGSTCTVQTVDEEWVLVRIVNNAGRDPEDGGKVPGAGDRNGLHRAGKAEPYEFYTDAGDGYAYERGEYEIRML
ncbi:MAG: DUF5110 domain-containing protein [Lachnospiraceae bacterium]|nr:DUF5110 domain-containing protein [Lachnospiraceae bacterium]